MTDPAERAPIRVLVCDDHAVVRSGLTGLIAGTDDLEVVGVAANGREAVEQVRRHRPDVALMDLQMPGGGGLGAIARLTAGAAAGGPAPRVIVVSMHDTEDYMLGALRAALVAGELGR